MTNTYREVPGSNGLYFIDISTKEGRCWSVRKQQYLKNTIHKRDKRIYWHLRFPGTNISYQAAKWIALTFPELVGGKYFEGAQIDHINTDPLDNRPCNLRWVTSKENSNNPLTLQNMSTTHKGKLINRTDQSKPVQQFTKDGELVASYLSIHDAAHKTGIDKSHIWSCCSKKQHRGSNGQQYITRSAGGFVWRYA